MKDANLLRFQAIEEGKKFQCGSKETGLPSDICENLLDNFQMASDKIDQLEAMIRTVLHLRSHNQFMMRKVVTGMDPWLHQMLALIRAQKCLSDLIKVDNIDHDMKELEEKVRSILKYTPVSKDGDGAEDDDDISSLYTVSAAS